MIRDRDRKLLLWLCRFRLCEIYMSYMRLPMVKARWRWVELIVSRMRKLQTRDDLHHAPCYPANHYHYQRLVFHRCTCGAEAAKKGSGIEE